MSRSAWMGIAFGAVFLAFAFWGVPLDELADAFAEMHAWPLAPIAVVFLLQQCIRAERQRILTERVAPGASFRSHLSILCMGFFCINTFPARLGEFARPLLFRRLEGVPIPASVGALIAERLIDLVGLVLAMTLVILLGNVSDARLPFAGSEIPLSDLVVRIAVGLLLPLLVALVLFFLFGQRTFAAIGDALRRRFPARHRLVEVARQAERTFGHVRDGLQVLERPRQLVAVALLTCLNFATFGVIGLLTAMAFDLQDHIGFVEALGVLCVAMLGIALPAPPGFAGVYEAAVRAGLALFGVVGMGLDSRALAFALVLHWWVYLVQAGSAAVFFWTDGVAPGSLLREVRRTPASDSQ